MIKNQEDWSSSKFVRKNLQFVGLSVATHMSKKES